jgi:hypothetical protein
MILKDKFILLTTQSIRAIHLKSPIRLKPQWFKIKDLMSKRASLQNIIVKLSFKDDQTDPQIFRYRPRQDMSQIELQ